jgi:hypothetical protein
MTKDPLAALIAISIASYLAVTVIVILAYLVGSIAVAIAANSRGRSAIGWLLVSLFLSPFFSVLLLIAMPFRNQDGLIIQREPML